MSRLYLLRDYLFTDRLLLPLLGDGYYLFHIGKTIVKEGEYKLELFIHKDFITYLSVPSLLSQIDYQNNNDLKENYDIEYDFFEISNHIEFMKLYPNDEDISLSTPAAEGNLSMIKYYLKQGATDIEESLESAIDFNHLEIIDYFLHYPYHSVSLPKIVVNVDNINLPTIKHLLSVYDLKGDVINIENGWASTLASAIITSNEAIVRYLLEAKDLKGRKINLLKVKKKIDNLLGYKNYIVDHRLLLFQYGLIDIKDVDIKKELIISVLIRE